MGCPYETICKHKDRVDNELEWRKAQKPVDPISPISRRGPFDKRSKKPKYHNLTTSDKDIKKARIILKDRKVKAMLTDEQVAASDQYKGVHTKNLTQAQREQILSIVKDSFKK